MSAFGYSVSFWGGCFMAFVMAACAVHLLWSSVWTSNWATVAKFAGTGIVAVTFLIVVNRGYVQTHRTQKPNADTLSAIQNLADLVRGISTDVHEDTHIVEVDGKYPDLRLDEPHEVPQSGGQTVLEVEGKNIGNATARAAMSTVSLFIAPQGVKYEDEIFNFLYKHEHDPDEDITYGDIEPGYRQTFVIGNVPREPNGTMVTNADRAALYEKTSVLYMAMVVSYQDSHGHIYHRELCYFATDTMSVDMKCRHHNGEG